MDELEGRLRALSQEATGELHNRVRPSENDLRRIKFRRTLSGATAMALIVLIVGASFSVISTLNDDPVVSSTGQTEGRAPIGSSGSQQGSAVSLSPDVVRVGDEAKLMVNRAPGIWGLRWRVERRLGSSWEPIGILLAGPGKMWAPRFYIGKNRSFGIPDIGFSRPATMTLEVPQLEPGYYRVGSEFLLKEGASFEDRLEWHYAEFEVIE